MHIIDTWQTSASQLIAVAAGREQAELVVQNCRLVNVNSREILDGWELAVVIILGLFSIFAWDFDLTVLAALLAVIGYSLNDTIVVSDRIRENFRNERVLEPVDMIDLSLNQTLGRTLVTSFTTLLVLFALFIFGGELIRGFSLALIIGVLIGTYSSIYVVANMLMSMTLTQEDLAVPEPEGADFDGMP